MPLGRYGQFNQAGDLAPKTGDQSQAILRNLGRLFVPFELVYAASGYSHFLGETDVVGVNETLVAAPAGYNGVTPAELQPSLKRIPPWMVGE